MWESIGLQLGSDGARPEPTYMLQIAYFGLDSSDSSACGADQSGRDCFDMEAMPGKRLS